ncbi:diaminopimelate epimerase [Tsuneonella sp. YG55]|uniref:Diaminopimelate epimerase n=1 Tax=Tsuneonella litorea TaxID=2976475 RepID=A0A9X2W2U2_9SPHN|nr:diaminopimelate epimerase [Tsuneonella litorea]MCT2559732.1 diaminopimelate epimerase [Tsuneonella litorea]
MRVPFIKMHGLGNDFVVLDARTEALPPIGPAAVAALAERRTGIGCDQLILLEPADDADFRMRIFNADGSEVEACGNASRAVALLHGKPARVQTAGGTIAVEPTGQGARIDMGAPRFEWDQLPLAYAMDTMSMPVGWDGLEAPAAVNVGNPHVVFFVADVQGVPLERLGPEIERDPLFPERVNVNVAQVTGPASIDLRVWERGAGLTRACGTGACATTVAAIRRGLIAGRTATVHLPGGPLEIEWDSDGRVLMTGPAAESFRGTFDWGDFA